MPQIKEDQQLRIVSLSKRLEEIAAERRKHLLHLVNLSVEARAVQLENDRLQNIDQPTLGSLAEQDALPSTFVPRGIYIPDEILAMIFEAGA